MRKILLFLMVSLVLAIISVNAEYYVDVKDKECRDNGQIRFFLSLDGIGEISTKDIEITLMDPTNHSTKINGEWGSDKILAYNQGGTLFKSDELVANLNGDYRVRLDYKFYQRSDKYELKTKEIYLSGCPGLLFSCKLLGLKIDDCLTENDGFIAHLTFKGFIPSDIKDAKIIDPYKGLDYEFKTEKKYTDLNGKYSNDGGLPISATITRTSKDKYVLESKLVNNSVNSLKIRFTDDRNYKYYYEIKKCIDEEEGFIKEIDKQCEVKVVKEPAPAREEIKEETKVIEEAPEVKEKPRDYTLYYMGGALILVIFIVALILIRSEES